MTRYSVLALLGFVAACAGANRPETAVAPAANDGASPTSPEPTTDSILDRELSAELKLAADSAADAAVLAELAEGGGAHGVGDSATTPASSEVTWDIDVETYVSHDRVQFWLDFFQTRARERMEVWLRRLPLYEDMIRARLAAEGLPTDLVYLALIESGMSNSAVSRSRAVGMWQFMRGTGLHYGLRIDSRVDERRDPFKATDAAARYLADLYERFGSLYLAAAAYNAGGGRISRSLHRLDEGESAATYTDADFFRLYDTRLLHRETRDYVPKLIAAALIAKQPERYGFHRPTDIGPLTYDSLVVEGMVGLDVVARLADTTVAAIRELNRQYLELTTPARGTWVIRLPSGTGAEVAAAYAALPPRERVSYVTHIVRRGDVLGRIAAKYDVSQRVILEANPRIKRRRNYMIKIGERLIIPTSGAVPAMVARTLAEREAPPRHRSVYHRVRRGESLWVIARRYEVTEQQIKRWNGLTSNRILTGQRLRIAAPASHRVRRGDTLNGLAKRYGVSVEAIKAANNLSSDLIRAGVTLKIPG